MMRRSDRSYAKGFYQNGVREPGELPAGTVRAADLNVPQLLVATFYQPTIRTEDGRPTYDSRTFTDPKAFLNEIVQRKRGCGEFKRLGIEPRAYERTNAHLLIAPARMSPKDLLLPEAFAAVPGPPPELTTPWLLQRLEMMATSAERLASSIETKARTHAGLKQRALEARELARQCRRTARSIREAHEAMPAEETVPSELSLGL